jgi:amidohydrolase
MRPTATLLQLMSTKALLLLTFGAAASLAARPTAAPASQDALLARVTAELRRGEADFIALRRDIHRHPEVSGNEVRTAALVAARLQALGMEVTTSVGGHGVVGVLRGGRPGPLLAYRADMDAVRSSDPDPVDYRSELADVRHICGHDVHTAIGGALATSLAAVRSQLTGSVMFIFQPAEENAVGARAMLEVGVFAREKPAAVFGAHTAPYEVGVLGTRSGGMMAARDLVRIELSGSGDLAAASRAARNLLMSFATVTDAQQYQPAGPDFVFVQMNADVTANSRVVASAQLTISSNSVRDQLQRTLATSLPALSGNGISVTHTYRARQVPGVTNDSATTSAAVAVLRRVLGDSAVRSVTTVVPAFSEDFGAFQEQVPGTFFFLGVSNAARGWVGMPHTPQYVADDASIVVGARAMAAVLLDRLR